MKCNFCREEIPEGTKTCPLCGSPINDKGTLPGQNAAFASQPVINGTLYLVLSVLATLLCCLPFGIIGIVFSSRINSQQNGGDYEGARTSARMATIFLTLSLVLGLVAGCVAAGLYAFIDNEDDNFYELTDYSEDIQTAPEGGEDGADGDLDGLVGEVKPAKQKAKLGEKWNSYTVQINDKVITLPCEYKDLAAAGMSIDESLGLDNDGMVAGGGYLIGALADAKGNSMTAEFINPDDTKKKAQECLVGGITVGEYDLKDSEFKVALPGGIQIGASKEEVTEKYGEPEETYEGDNLHVFTWNESEMFFSTVEADFDSKSGKLVQISMKNYGSENVIEN